MVCDRCYHCHCCHTCTLIAIVPTIVLSVLIWQQLVVTATKTSSWESPSFLVRAEPQPREMHSHGCPWLLQKTPRTQPHRNDSLLKEKLRELRAQQVSSPLAQRPRYSLQVCTFLLPESEAGPSAPQGVVGRMLGGSGVWPL